ncbi:hypothetical protein Mal15_46950 [Stieleria maiorica]|uniref:Lipid/polyisoprenoid-binding YceI-like domain-containing protein n=1 Tax=Stieleria maiorica TaxID=2795974 RepID=A0A5B9MI86_9BACT|nr:YceI family protein [Stieleria maiorica]QEG00624.1 hypothetical protein Mal15_46950 [Stieleria maiorica]
MKFFATLMTVSVLSLAVQQPSVLGQSPAAAAPTTYKIDNDHTSVQFKISHLGISWVHGRFNETSGKFTMDADQVMTSIELTMQVKSVDTKNEKRDAHLRSPDFFDAERFPEITFESTAIKPSDKGLDVTGIVTLHGQTRPLSFVLVGGDKAEFPEGVHRTGYTTAFTLKRSDFGMKTMLGPVGDEVRAEVSFEGIRQ